MEAVGLNFRDMFVALGMLNADLGGEFCGRVIEVGEDVTTVAVGDRVVGLALTTFRSEAVMREEMVAPAPAGLPVAALATIPMAFVSAALSFEAIELKAGDRVLIHAASGGVGQAAVQLAPGCRGGGVRDRECAETGFGASTRRGARLRQPPDRVHAGDS